VGADRVPAPQRCIDLVYSIQTHEALIATASERVSMKTKLVSSRDRSFFSTEHVDDLESKHSAPFLSSRSCRDVGGLVRVDADTLDAHLDPRICILFGISGMFTVGFEFGSSYPRKPYQFCQSVDFLVLQGR